jgi:hypothetical protein
MMELPDQYYQAMNEWRSVLGQDPGNLEARLGLARAAAKAGDRAPAAQEYSPFSLRPSEEARLVDDGFPRLWRDLLRPRANSGQTVVPHPLVHQGRVPERAQRDHARHHVRSGKQRRSVTMTRWHLLCGIGD